MRALIIALPILITFLLGWAAHAWMVRRRPVLDKAEQKELAEKTDLVDRLFDLSLNHIESEPFAVIVIDEIRKSNRTIREGESA